jgi:hypothetical protein
VAVTTEGVTLQRVAGDAKGVSATYRLLGTQIRSHDRSASRSSLAAGQRVVAEVRTCAGAGWPTEVRLLTLVVLGVPTEVPNTAPTGGSDSGGTGQSHDAPAHDAAAGDAASHDTPPAPDCARGDFTAVLGAVGVDGISFSSNGAEGPKTFSVAVTADTSISKHDAAVGLTALAPGDRLHVWVVRCQTAPPTLRATRIVDLGPASSA